MRASIFVLTVLLLAAAPARASIPAEIAVQGVLRDSDGKLQSMMVQVSAALFDAPTGGNMLAGPYGPASVMATNGLFSFPINDSSLGTVAETAAQIWLQVTVDGTPFSRQQLTPQLFALFCGTSSVARSIFANDGKSALEVQTDNSGSNFIASGLTPTSGSAAPLYFTDYDAAHIWMTVAASGNIGIGTTTPAAKLSIQDASDANMTFQAGSGTRFWIAAGSTANTFLIGGAGGSRPADALFPIVVDGLRVGIGGGATLPDQALSVNGDASKTTGGMWLTFSDERLKNVKGAFTAGLKELMQLQPVRYEYKRDNALGLTPSGEQVGFVAQAVRRVLPEAVLPGTRGYLQLKDDPILWTMLNAIKEQQGEIERLRGENGALQARLARLESAVAHLAADESGSRGRQARR